jgi:hypothetical protein
MLLTSQGHPSIAEEQEEANDERSETGHPCKTKSSEGRRMKNEEACIQKEKLSELEDGRDECESKKVELKR